MDPSALKRYGIVTIFGVFAALFAVMPGYATNLSMWDFAVFSGGGYSTNQPGNYETYIGQNVIVNGLLGSNQDLQMLAGSQINASAVYVGGHFDMGTNAKIGSAAQFANVIVNGANVGSGNAADVNGDIYGNLYVTGDLQLQSNADLFKVGGIGGNVQYTGALSGSGPNSLAGSLTHVASTTTFTPISMPAPTSFTASSNASDDRSCTGSCSSLTLAPSTYRNLDIGTSKTLKLQSGNYYFNTVNINSGLQLYLDLSSGNPLNIYVVGVANFGQTQQIFVKRPGDSDFTEVSSLADKSIASLVYLETLDKFNINANSEWLGTVYASKLEVNGSSETYFGNSVNVWGGIYAFDSIEVLSGTTINYVGSYRDDPQVSAVPEPASLTLLGLGLLGIAAFARRRAREELIESCYKKTAGPDRWSGPLC